MSKFDQKRVNAAQIEVWFKEKKISNKLLNDYELIILYLNLLLNLKYYLIIK